MNWLNVCVCAVLITVPGTLGILSVASVKASKIREWPLWRGGELACDVAPPALFSFWETVKWPGVEIRSKHDPLPRGFSCLIFSHDTLPCKCNWGDLILLSSAILCVCVMMHWCFALCPGVWNRERLISNALPSMCEHVKSAREVFSPQPNLSGSLMSRWFQRSGKKADCETRKALKFRSLNDQDGNNRPCISI